jgi:thioredoxin-related protein
MKQSLKLFSLFALAAFLMGTFAFSFKTEDHGPVKWMKFSEALEKNKKVPKMIFIDIYTTWCGPCKMLTANTFSNEKIAKYMNENFYCVKFDAETRDTVKFTMQVPDTLRDKKGKVVKIGTKPQVYQYYNTFPPTASRSTHQFVSSILEGKQIAFPSLVILSKKVQRIDVLQGYMPPAQFEPVIKFFGSGAWETTKWEEYQKTFKSELSSQ